ncbi:MAG: dephospho-CoA kinase [Bacteroidota bacterium]
MIKIAVTGNIGSGKTTVCRIFESLGIAVYYADAEAKKLYAREDVRQATKALFGEHIFDNDNKLRSAELAEIVFSDPARLQQLNNIIHPLVLDDFLAWTKEHAAEKYIIYESALLFESGFSKYFNKRILISTPENIAMSRVMHRDGISASDFQSRAKHQMKEEEKQKLADHIIYNDESLPLIPRVMELHELIISQLSA